LTKKSKPASLTSSLLARKGEAEPAETPYSIAEASGKSTDSSSTEPTPTNIEQTADLSESAGNGNGQSMEGFGRLPLGDQDAAAEPRSPDPEATSGGFTLPEGIQAGDPPITEPVITEPTTDPIQETALDLSNLGTQAPEVRSESFDTGAKSDIEADSSAPKSALASDNTDTSTITSAAVTPEAQDAVPPPVMPSALTDEEPVDASIAAAADAEREAARDARLLRFVYIMAALTGIVAIVLYAGGWFVDKDTPQVADQTPPTESVASAGSTDKPVPSQPAVDDAKPSGTSEPASSEPASSETPAPTPEPSATPSGPAAIPAAPPIAAPGFGESGTKSGETAITTGGKAKATVTPESKPDTSPAAGDKKSASGIEVETLKPPATPALKVPDAPTVTAKAPESAPAGSDAPKSVTPSSGTGDAKSAASTKADGKESSSTSGTDGKVAVVSPEKPVEFAAKPVVDPAVKAGAAAVPAESPKVPDVQPPPVLTAPKLPSAQKPAAAAKPAKKVPNLRVLAPALVRPDPPQANPAAKPKAGAAKPSATAQIPTGSKTAALTKPKKPTAAPSKSSGKFLIQLASVKSQKRAEAEWARLKKSFPKVFGERELVVEKRTIAGRGTFYRVQTGRFETLKDARAMCASLKSKKQACLPVTRGKS
jgi:hypothetical protein